MQRYQNQLRAVMAGMLFCGVSVSHVAFADNDGRGHGNDHEKKKDTSFTRMFHDLPPGLPPTDEARDLVKHLGAKDGLIDAKEYPHRSRAVDYESGGVQSEQSGQSKYDRRNDVCGAVSRS